MTSRQARALATLLALAAPGLALAEPLPTVALAARAITPDPRCPVPDKGAFYLFTARGLRRADVARLEELGLVYLGVLGPHAYALIDARGRPAAVQAFLRAQPYTVGTAAAAPQDKLRSDVLDRLGERAPERKLPFGLAVTLWPGTPAGEARRLLPEAQEDLRWPTADSARIGLEHAAYLSKAASTVDRLERLLAAPYVAAIGFDAPRVSFNEQSRLQSHSNEIFDTPYGLDGAGVLVGHWDGGEVDEGHPDLAGRVENLDDAEVSRHATHTAGTILGSGFGDPDARGHAPAATMVARTYNGNAPGERRVTKHTHYHQHDNHSWGQDPDTVSNFGTYNQVGYELDVDARDLFLLAVKAAGNEGRESEVIVETVGFDSLSPDSTSKNALVVGATDDRGALAVFSSRGPTEDGRIKPDICAVGVGVRSTVPGAAYGASNGTSMSTPGVSGMLALLSQLWTREHGTRWAPDLARGLMIHTAQDVWNRGPDYRYGWGLADARAAADLILADVASGGRNLVRGAVREGEAAEWTMQVPAGHGPLRVTVSWLDAFANPPAARLLLHDLDLVLVGPDGTEHFPWSLSPNLPLADATRAGRNPSDNVEQVLVDAPTPGTWTVRITGTELSDPNLAVQGFVLLSDVPVEHHVFRFVASFDQNHPRSLPDADEAGRAVTFEVPDVGAVTAVRLLAEIQHEARGDLRIILEGPDGTRATVEAEDESERRDIYAIYPDTRSYDDDVLAFVGKPSYGTWTVYVVDTARGDIGQIRALALELDTDGQVNQPPTAIATADDPVLSGDTGRLYGGASLDPEGRPLTFAWTQLDGPSVALEGADTDTASYVAPEVSEDAVVTFELVVDDGRGETARAEVSATLKRPNEGPVATAGEDLTVEAGSGFSLDATGSSDPDGDALTYRWRQLTGPDLGAQNASQAILQLTAPSDRLPDGPITFELTVDDGRMSATDTVQVTVVAVGGLAAEDGCTCTSSSDRRGALGVLAFGVLLLVRRRRQAQP